MKNLWIVLVALMLIFTGCVKKADRIAKENASNDSVAEMELIYKNAIDAFREGNLHRTTYLHKKNCDLGYGESCNILGNFYYKGNFLLQDLTKVQTFYHRACKLGSKVGCQNEGNILRLVSKDFPAAFAVYQDNCSNDYYDSCYNLAMLYLQGRGVKQNGRKAKYYFKKACDGQIVAACEIYTNLLKQKQK